MMIELTEHPSKTKLYLRASSIKAIRDFEDRTMIMMDEGHAYEVEEHPDVVASLMLLYEKP